MPPLKAFMDDKTILSSKEPGTRSLLSHLDDLMIWCRMAYKPKKSRSLSLRSGKVSQETKFQVGGQDIPTVSEMPVKSLGRWYDDSLKDTKQVKETVKTAEENLQKIDRRPLPGKYKVWCLQHMLIPMLLWPLLIYEVATSTVEAIERKINKFTRKWLGVPPGLTDVALYCKQAKLRLPLKSIVEEYKAGKVRLQMMLEDSPDEVVKSVQPSLRTGKKWKVQDAVVSAKENLIQKEVIGLTQSGRMGLGINKVQWWSKVSGKNRRDLVIQEVRNEENKSRYVKAVQQSQQGQWTNWDEALQRTVTWNDLWQMAPLRVSFILRATYDLLPSRTNLVKWGKENDPMCPLCKEKPQTMDHVLSSCKIALANGRYTWRHNKVLTELARSIKEQMQPETKDSALTFVTEGKKKKWVASKKMPEISVGRNLIGTSEEWSMSADLPEWQSYPEFIKKTGQRPDIVLWSESGAWVSLVELSVPYESRLNEQHEYKLRKYEDLANQVTSEGYKCTIKPVEVGARGFVSASTCQLLGQLGIKGHKRTATIKRLSETAEKCSMWLWARRNDSWS